MACHRLSLTLTGLSTASTATADSILSKSSILTSVTSIASNISNTFNKDLPSFVQSNPPVASSPLSSLAVPEFSSRRSSLAVPEFSSRRSSLAVPEFSSRRSSIVDFTPIVTERRASIAPEPTAQASTPVAPATASNLVKEALSQFSLSKYTTAIRLRKTQNSTRKQERAAVKSARKSEKVTVKATKKAENRARSKAYFADFYANDSLGAWHNSAASGQCSCGCNDSDVEMHVAVADLIAMQPKSQVSQVTRMVDGRPVMINF